MAMGPIVVLVLVSVLVWVPIVSFVSVTIGLIVIPVATVAVIIVVPSVMLVVPKRVSMAVGPAVKPKREMA
jgi:hypothetical protein